MRSQTLSRADFDCFEFHTLRCGGVIRCCRSSTSALHILLGESSPRSSFSERLVDFLRFFLPLIFFFLDFFLLGTSRSSSRRLRFFFFLDRSRCLEDLPAVGGSRAERMLAGDAQLEELLGEAEEDGSPEWAGPATIGVC